jgi:hypothetical protein
MEEFFNLPPAEQDIEITQEEFIPTKNRNELMSEAKEIFNSLSTIEKIDIALPVVEDLKEHNAEMDEISKRAIKSFEDLMELGGNIPDMHAGKIFEVAGVMLKTAMEAKNAKAEKKLRMIELQIKKARLDQLGGNEGSNNGNTVPSGEFDRNELLKHIIDASKSENSDK